MSRSIPGATLAASLAGCSLGDADFAAAPPTA